MIITIWIKMGNEINYSGGELKDNLACITEYMKKLAKVYIGEGVKYPHCIDEGDECKHINRL